MKVKLFSKKDSFFGRRKNLDLENEINEWLKKNPSVKVIEIKQSASGGSLEPCHMVRLCLVRRSHLTNRYTRPRGLGHLPIMVLVFKG